MMQTRTIAFAMMLAVCVPPAAAMAYEGYSFSDNIHAVADPDQPGWAIQNGGDTLTVAFEVLGLTAYADFESGVNYSMTGVVSAINAGGEYIARVASCSRTGLHYLRLSDGLGHGDGGTEGGGALIDIWKVSGAADLSELVNLDSVEDDFVVRTYPSFDLQDFDMLKANFGITKGATWGQGDFNADGAVDLQDFGLLKAGLSGDFSPCGSAVIPEPATLSLLLIATVLIPRRRRKQCC